MAWAKALVEISLEEKIRLYEYSLIFEKFLIEVIVITYIKSFGPTKVLGEEVGLGAAYLVGT